MTANDKTGEKLVDSMRKTKAAAADKNDAAQNPTQASQTQTSQTKKSQPQAKKKTAAKRSSGDARKRGGNPYQSGRRIWPD
jgi:hypothetical protein